MIPNHSPDQSPVLDAALAFAKAGCSVVPAAMNGSKAPIGTWKKYQSHTANEAQIRQWFTPLQTGLGVITGTVSGNLEMIEMEGRAVAENLHVEVKEIAYNSGLQEIWDAIATGYMEKTPSGGIHILYRIADADVPGNTKLARRPGENGGVDVLAETRGEGGFVVVAPSHGQVHPSGGAWELWRGGPATIPTLTWEQRCAIIACFKALDAMPTASTAIDAISPREQSQGVSPGDDFNDRASWDEILLPLGWSKVFVSGVTTYWRRPGKSVGISATTGRNDGDNLYVFTTSTTFEAERPYSKWAAYTHIHFHGDFKASARHLRTMGYGSIAVVQEQGQMPTQAPTEVSAISTDSGNADLSQEPEQVRSREEIEFEYQLQQARIRQKVKQVLEQESGVPDFDESHFADSSWKPVDFAPFINGTHDPIKPSLLKRADGQFLLYPGKVHSFYGESESGKSWVAQYVAAQELIAKRKVIYIDFESDAFDLYKRLLLLGVSNEEISSHWTYIKPESARNIFDPYWRAILEPGTSLVVIDGVTEALTMWGGETKDNDSITRWMRDFPRKIAGESGAAVVQIDHVTKNAETRGRFAIGGQAKLATVDGAAYLIEPLEAVAPGRVGQLTMRVTKDRPGYIRSISGFYRKSDRTQEATCITIDSVNPSAINFTLSKPLEEEEIVQQREDRLSAEIMSFIAANPMCSKNMVTKAVTGAAATIGERINQLLNEGKLQDLSDNNRPRLYLTEIGAEDFNLIYQPPVIGDVG